MTSMNKEQQRKIIDLMTALADTIKDEPGFIEDAELRAVYVIVHSAMSAVMFGETTSLAQTCADWCGDTARLSAERN